jgi:hypothetical protein
MVSVPFQGVAPRFRAVSAPWFVAVSLRNPEFAHFFFVQEHSLRSSITPHSASIPRWWGRALRSSRTSSATSPAAP